ncbi:hypothetical protein BT69DRAFT_1351904 [Atractiella rhizophila]|nr:hypothetical protein BT69DRAFT_1351904 [Atractiella rhizophila]
MGRASTSKVRIEDGEKDIRKLLKSASAQANVLLSRLSDLEEENESLKLALEAQQRELEQVTTAAAPNQKERRANSKKVSELEKKIRELEKTNRKQNRKLKQYKSSSLAREARDLAISSQRAASPSGSTPVEVQDTYWQMRNLLSRIANLLSQPTIGDEEDCPICMERLDLSGPHQAGSLPCDHIVCLECVPQLPRSMVRVKELGQELEVKFLRVDDEDEDGAGFPMVDAFECPQCRKKYVESQVVEVEMTESGRWDKLVDMAMEWRRLQVQHDSEPEEEPFIDDGDDGEEQEESVPSPRIEDTRMDGGSLMDGLPPLDDSEIEAGARDMDAEVPNTTAPDTQTSHASSSALLSMSKRGGGDEEDALPNPTRGKRKRKEVVGTSEEEEEDVIATPKKSRGKLRAADGASLPPKPDLMEPSSADKRKRLGLMAEKRKGKSRLF